METDEQLEEFVKGLDENIESVTTCQGSHPEGGMEHGVVLTIKGIDVVLLQSDLEEIAEYLGSLPIL